MKNCPVCGATCFDDMDTCFDCLHQFGEQGGAELEIALACSQEAALQETDPVVTAEYSKVPSDCSEGTSESHCITLRIQLPEGAGEFSVRCENLQIEGVLQA